MPAPKGNLCMCVISFMSGGRDRNAEERIRQPRFDPDQHKAALDSSSNEYVLEQLNNDLNAFSECSAYAHWTLDDA